MLHPLERISLPLRQRYFLPLVILTLLIMVVMNTAGAPLKSEAAPAGIVSYEFAYTSARAQAILDSWDAAAKVRACFVQGLDFLFPPVYAMAIALGCLLAAGALARKGLPLAQYGSSLAWGTWMAALFDYVENVALVIQLFNGAASPWAEIAAICAGVKFAMLLSGLLFALYGLAAGVLLPRNRR